MNNVNSSEQQYLAQMNYFRNKRRYERNELIKTGIIIGTTLIMSLFVQILVVLGLQMSPYYSVYTESSLFQNAFNIIAVDICSLLIPFFIMSRILKKRYQGDLIPKKSLGKVTAFAWVSLGMGGCVGANFIAAFVISLFKQFGYKLTQPEYNDPSSIIECIVVVFSTAVAPAIFEEFAMRCCTLGALRKYGKGFAVVAVSIVFGLIHQNVIQFVFAFCVGMILFYITFVTDSIVPAILIHGFNNFISVLNDIIKYFAKTDLSEYVSSSLYIMWIILAIWGAIYLIVKKQIIPKRQSKLREPYALSFGAKLLCLLPGFLLPFLIMIYFTTKTIVPIT